MKRWTAYATVILTGYFALVLAACEGSRFGAEARQPRPGPVANGLNQRPLNGGSTNTVNYEQELEGQGNWVVIGDERYFVPDTKDYESQGVTWQPYQNGSWSYDEGQDWTWASNEPWGNVTDHYGVWRHHTEYKWIWLPFPDRHYESHTVTWFDDGDYIGWYPYHSTFAGMYRLDNRYGFDDGYWGGFAAVLSTNGSQFQFNMGFTLVPRADVITDNILDVMVREQDLIFGYAYRAHQHDRIVRVGRYPGGQRMNSLAFIERYSRHKAPRGRAGFEKSRGNGRFMQPHRSQQRPADNGRSSYRREGSERRESLNRNERTRVQSRTERASDAATREAKPQVMPKKDDRMTGDRSRGNQSAKTVPAKDKSKADKNSNEDDKNARTDRR